MRIIAIAVVFLTLTSFEADISGPWNRIESDRVIVYSRPEGFSKTKP
jgi:hypothetical protein